MVLAAEFGDSAAVGVVPAALVVELTHLATLYHDDVMDEAELRRGSPSANARWDNSVAILTGDFLFARAAEIVAGLGPEAVLIQARTFGRLVQGHPGDGGAREGEDPIGQHHLSVVPDRTGEAADKVSGGKNTMYEEDIRVPLWIRHRASPGRRWISCSAMWTWRRSPGSICSTARWTCSMGGSFLPLLNRGHEPSGLTPSFRGIQ